MLVQLKERSEYTCSSAIASEICLEEWPWGLASRLTRFSAIRDGGPTFYASVCKKMLRRRRTENGTKTTKLLPLSLWRIVCAKTALATSVRDKNYVIICLSDTFLNDMDRLTVLPLKCLNLKSFSYDPVRELGLQLYTHVQLVGRRIHA